MAVFGFVISVARESPEMLDAGIDISKSLSHDRETVRKVRRAASPRHARRLDRWEMHWTLMHSGGQ
jgi:hypothetical protein